ncbi:uncharacterized protein LOC100443937 isoform X12 [Pongo abelii]|uniref:uncharacterized protein LOC100443937 isoform X12 n=1 Tax=Pongo abelii TaxID=9601 RepID=UPI0023E10420|nr:dexamethasone-induced protein isoform X7 [Pongo pygmaeus]XP_054389447.1 uncharacterized protein LOC100443937 isoform X11 [Pongo abelii]
MVPQEETLPCLRGLSNWMPGMARLLLSPSFGLESFPQQRGQLVKRKGTPRGHGPVQRQATSPLLSVSFQPPGDGQTPAMPSSRDKACSPQKLRANREVPVWTQESGREIGTDC